MTLARFFKTAPSRDLLLLTPASLFLIDMETGVLKRDLAIPFHHHATCMRTFPKIYDDPTKGKNSFDCLLVATQSQHIIVYQEWTCVWITKQSSSIPITLRVNTFGSHKGLVTTLSRTGDLTISYLSTTERLALPANSVEQSTSAGGGGLNNNPVPGQVTTSNGSSSSAGAAAKSRSKANANITGTLSNLSLSSFFTFECEIQHDPRAIDLFTVSRKLEFILMKNLDLSTSMNRRGKVTMGLHYWELKFIPSPNLFSLFTTMLSPTAGKWMISH